MTAVVLAGGYYLFLPPDNRETNNSAIESAVERTPAECLEQAGKYLAEGSFRLAADELRANPHGLDASQRRRWRQLKQEAALLADLCGEPLEDILQHAAGVAEREWRAEFAGRYAGKALVFDTVLQRKESGNISGIYLFAGPDKTRLEFGDVHLLRGLPLDQPQRVLFGVRLASIALEPPGPVWIIHFQPESGVLLTNGTAAGLCCPALNEPDAVRLLAEQKQLVESRE